MAHHKLDCTTGLMETLGASSRPSTTYRGRTGMGFSFTDSAFMKSGSAQAEVLNPTPSSSEAFPGRLSRATRAPASPPEPRERPSESSISNAESSVDAKE
jgi:hypothetical protein